jgi:hypothetical protein
MRLLKGIMYTYRVNDHLPLFRHLYRALVGRQIMRISDIIFHYMNPSFGNCCANPFCRKRWTLGVHCIDCDIQRITRQGDLKFSYKVYRLLFQRFNPYNNKGK